MERVIAGVTLADRAEYRFDYEIGYDPVVNDRDRLRGGARRRSCASRRGGARRVRHR